MNNIYVDELPKDCWNCQFLDKEYFNNCYCGICQKEFDDEDLYVSEESFEHKKAECCPLKSLKDALAEERKKVVQEIREPIIKSLKNGIVRKDPKSNNRNLRDIILFQVLDILDQVKRSK